MKLLLFDIDGTLLHTRGMGRQAVREALAEVCGRPLTLDSISFSGKTDPQIMGEILSANSFDAAERKALAPAALNAYAMVIEERLRPEHVEVLPGVRALLERLAASEAVQLALLTGNVERVGYLKLRAAGLDGYFPFGAFGSDDPDRCGLPTIAVRRAHRHTGRRFVGRNVVVIGDTEHDIRCGRSIGAFSVGVCTGRYSRETLAAHAPAVLLDDLHDTGAFFSRVVEV